MRISDWSSDVCSSDLDGPRPAGAAAVAAEDFCETPISASAFLMRSIDVCERLNSTRMVPAALTSASMTPGTLRRRSEEHTSELQSLMRISYAVFCLKKKKQHDSRTR